MFTESIRGKCCDYYSAASYKISLQGKNDFVKVSKNLDADLKIISFEPFKIIM